MSRIGKMPITVPAGVDVKIDGDLVTVKGKLGTLEQKISPRVTVEYENNTITVSIANENDKSRAGRGDNALWGLTRSLINNMVIGVSEGYQKKLEIVGVGYNAQKNGKTLTLNVGYSHPITFEETDDVTFECPDAVTIIVKSASKQAVGEIASQIRSKRPPEPYLGKGIKYSGEYIRRKAGKAGKAAH
ncbi:MAG TPA: 50S ribosomal protein L6 [Clostridiales bacterium]|jgi:large subunit ribosomal protein L6|nr:50S ribosomal protein L6 [Clostridiales bacterium]